MTSADQPQYTWQLHSDIDDAWIYQRTRCNDVYDYPICIRERVGDERTVEIYAKYNSTRVVEEFTIPADMPMDEARALAVVRWWVNPDANHD